VLLSQNVSRHDSKCVALKLINKYDIVTVDDLLEITSSLSGRREKLSLNVIVILNFCTGTRNGCRTMLLEDMIQKLHIKWRSAMPTTPMKLSLSMDHQVGKWYLGC
jgi:hypothetical protein